MPNRQLLAPLKGITQKLLYTNLIWILFVFIYPYAYNLAAAAKINPR